jgi:hypothetical protein
MVYRDDEDELLYVTSKVLVQKGEIVAYRCTYLNNVVGREEPEPIRVADVERMLNTYLTFSQPLVVLAGDVSATKIEALQTSSIATPSTSSGSHFKNIKQTDNISASGAKRSAETSSGSSFKRHASGIGVQGSRNDHNDKTATTAHDSSLDVQPTGTTSHRHPRAAHGKKNHIINIGRAEDIALHVQLNLNNDVYHLNMPKYDVFDHTPSALYNDDSEYNENKDKWDEADMRELKSLILEHQVWDVRPRTTTKKPMTSKWVRLVKSNNTYKSRLVCRGFNMIPGVDYDDTFSPVAKMVTFRIFLTFVALYNLETASLDVKTAFLNAKMEKEVEMLPPPNLKDLMRKLIWDSNISYKDTQEISRQLNLLESGGILVLLKALYGTKEAGRLWYIDIDSFLKNEGFKPNNADHCFYTLTINDKEYVLLLLYVDDIIIAATSRALVQRYINIIGRKYRITSFDTLTQYLNIQIDHIPQHKTIYLCQKDYIEMMFKDFTFSPNESITTPIDEKLKLTATEEENLTQEQLHYVSLFPYRKVIGAILYVNVCTRPSISYAISTLAQFVVKPTFKACKALVRLAQFVYNTRKDRLALGGNAKLPHITAYCDSDWGGCPMSRLSRSGHIIFMGNGPVVWYSKKQSNVACSSCEAEYMAMSPCIQNINYCRRIVNCANIPNVKYRLSSGLWSDNEAAIAISADPVLHQRTKHIHIKYQYVNENVANGTIKQGKTPSRTNYSDMMTKAQGRNIFGEHYPFVMGGQSIPLVEDLVMTTEEDTLPCPRCAMNNLLIRDR